MCIRFVSFAEIFPRYSYSLNIYHKSVTGKRKLEKWKPYIRFRGNFRIENWDHVESSFQNSSFRFLWSWGIYFVGNIEKVKRYRPELGLFDIHIEILEFVGWILKQGFHFVQQCNKHAGFDKLGAHYTENFQHDNG